MTGISIPRPEVAMPRRIATVLVAAATLLLAACANPTAPVSRDCGVTNGSSTC
jgi:predicted small secreted protein